MKANRRAALYLILLAALGETWFFLPRPFKEGAEIVIMVVVLVGLTILLAYNKRKFGLFFPGPITSNEAFAPVVRDWSTEIGESLSYFMCLLLAAVLTGLFLFIAVRVSGRSLSTQSWVHIFAAVSLPLGALLMYLLARYRKRY